MSQCDSILNTWIQPPSTLSGGTRKKVFSLGDALLPLNLGEPTSLQVLLQADGDFRDDLNVFFPGTSVSVREI